MVLQRIEVVASPSSGVAGGGQGYVGITKWVGASAGGCWRHRMGGDVTVWAAVVVGAAVVGGSGGGQQWWVLVVGISTIP